MKFLLPTLLACSLLSAKADPDQLSDKTKISEKKNEQKFIHQVLLQLDYIQITQEQFGDLTFGDGMKKTGTQLRTELQKMIKANKAKLLETSLASTVSGKECRITSARHTIYPTEFDPPEIIPDQIRASDGLRTKAAAMAPTATSFEERPVGLICEAKATVSPNKKVVSVDLDVTWVGHEGLIRWATWKDKFGESHLGLPKFSKIEAKTGITVGNGEYRLLSVHSRNDSKGNTDPNKKILIFIRAVVL